MSIFYAPITDFNNKFRNKNEYKVNLKSRFIQLVLSHRKHCSYSPVLLLLEANRNKQTYRLWQEHTMLPYLHAKSRNVHRFYFLKSFMSDTTSNSQCCPFFIHHSFHLIVTDTFAQTYGGCYNNRINLFFTDKFNASFIRSYFMVFGFSVEDTS